MCYHFLVHFAWFQQTKTQCHKLVGRFKRAGGSLHLLYVPLGITASCSRPARTLSVRRCVSSRCPSLAHPALFIATGQLRISPSVSVSVSFVLLLSSVVMWKCLTVSLFCAGTVVHMLLHIPLGSEENRREPEQEINWWHWFQALIIPVPFYIIWRGQLLWHKVLLWYREWDDVALKRSGSEKKKETGRSCSVVYFIFSNNGTDASARPGQGAVHSRQMQTCAWLQKMCNVALTWSIFFAFTWHLRNWNSCRFPRTIGKLTCI